MDNCSESVQRPGPALLPHGEEQVLICRKSGAGEWSGEILEELGVKKQGVDLSEDEAEKLGKLQYDEYTVLSWPSKTMLRCGVVNGVQSSWKPVDYGLHEKCETKEEFFDVEMMIENEDVF